MEKFQQILVANINEVGIVNISTRKCQYCGALIPIYRNRGALYCNDSCKSMHCRSKNSENYKPIELPVKQNTELNQKEDEVVTPTPLKTFAKEVMTIHSAIYQSEVDFDKISKWDQDAIIKRGCQMTRNIENIVKLYLKNNNSEIPVNKIHSLLPTNIPLDEVESLVFPKYTLRLNNDHSKYLICII